MNVIVLGNTAAKLDKSGNAKRELITLLVISPWAECLGPVQCYHITHTLEHGAVTSARHPSHSQAHEEGQLVKLYPKLLYSYPGTKRRHILTLVLVKHLK